MARAAERLNDGPGTNQKCPEPIDTNMYFWQPKGDTKHGIGAFASVGVSDGNPNPIKWALVTGIGGRLIGLDPPQLRL